LEKRKIDRGTEGVQEELTKCKEGYFLSKRRETERMCNHKGIKDSQKEYMEKLVNEENEWDHRYRLELKKDLQIASDR